MAQTVTLEGLRSQLLTSVFGRRLGMAYGNSSDAESGIEPQYLVGVKGVLTPTLNLTTASTAADQIPPFGTVYITGNTTSGSTYNGVQNPVPGQGVIIVNGSTMAVTVYLNGSTGTTGVLGYSQPSGAATSGLTTGTAVNLPKLGTYVALTALTTGIWFVDSNWGTSVTTWGSSMT